MEYIYIWIYAGSIYKEYIRICTFGEYIYIYMYIYEKVFWGRGTTSRSLRCRKGHVQGTYLWGWGANSYAFGIISLSLSLYIYIYTCSPRREQ